MTAVRYVVVTLAFVEAGGGPARAILAAARSAGARVAALQGGGAPSLVTVLDELAAHGDEPVRLVAATGAGPDAGHSWVRRVASHWLRTRGCALPIDCVAGVQRTPEQVLSALAGQGAARPVTDGSAKLHSPAWQAPPPHRHHVLVCRGPRCNAQGAQAGSEALCAELAGRGMLDDPVLVAETGCLFPCNRAPVVVVHPDNSWHGPVRAEHVADFIDTHLGGTSPARPGPGHESMPPP